MEAMAATQDLSPLFLGERDVQEDFLHVGFRDHRAKFRGRIQRIACHHLRGLRHEGFFELVVDGALNEDAGAAKADLTLVRE